VSEETFRVAVVGAGRMGRVHITALERSRKVDVEAVVEPVESTRSALARRGLPVFTTVAELLEEGGIDGVLIAAPTDRHLKLVEMVVGAGLPVLCEKPVGRRAADAGGAAAAVG
jgi:myo-inositol 2-dehydrogenase / D-chiro-inositol 1-dehydrogenase